ncbi:MAG: hypothetical protein ACOZFS_07100 [Thermodesulfobacteriota bacterium]
MKKTNLPNHSHSIWGKLLLASGLLLFFVAGFVQLYEVQTWLSPGKYYDIQINLIREDFAKIEKGLKSLRTEVEKLNGLCMPLESSNPHPSGLSLAGSPAPQSGNCVQPNSDPVWQAALHAAKKDRVFVVRKLKYIDAKLQSLQRSSSHNDAIVAGNPGTKETKGELQDIRAIFQTYTHTLDTLAEQLNHLEGSRKKF